jgi:hypothetical protein
MAEAPEPAPDAESAEAVAPRPADDVTPPMLPSRWAFLLAFGGVVLAGILGGIIGFGIADVSSQSDLSHLIGAFVGAVIGAGGVGVVAVLVLRAMAEWRRQNPQA